MRLTLTTLALLLSTMLFAQAPALIPYQAIARNAAGEPLASITLNARFTILDLTATGTSVWQELQTVSTSALGLFTVQLGSSVSLAGVNWANGAKFMQVELDLGNGFVDIGTQQLLSVPYALFAATSGSSTPGPAGPQGPIGLTGPAGATGAQGPIGLTGATGATGPQGPIGLTGPAGATGAQGPIGLTGATGATGPQGPIGLTGPAGATGAQGPIGLTGATGASGPQGPIGLTGPAGATGAQGPIGLTGATGAAGPQGPAGNGFSNGTATNQLMYWNGSAWVTLNPGGNGQILTLCNGALTWTTGGNCQGSISALNCSSATAAGTLTAGTAAGGVSSTIAYTGGNGGAYSAQSIASTGVTGLTATLTGGTLASGAGTVTYTITGTPSASGTASFALSLGGQSCTLTRTVVAASGAITALNCSSATASGTLTAGTAAGGVSSTITYTGGNGGSYSAQSIASTGVTGLTATLTGGTLASGAGTVTYTITGTPSASGTASFALSLGGQSCTLTRAVLPAAGGGGTAATCGTPNIHNPGLTYGSMTDQQGNVYKTIVIGTQEWMAENLNTSIYRNGDAIPTGLTNVQWQNTTSTQLGAWAYYNNDASYACPYGKLYNWYACTDARQLCPVGWHVPTDDEWTTLAYSLVDMFVAGGKMKTTGTVEAGTGLWLSPNFQATNSSGFSGVPGGGRDFDGVFVEMGETGNWWSSSESIPGNGWGRGIFSDSNVVGNLSYFKRHGFSVRCLKD
ncbi:MAG: FISUMP domain-containing protein [Flavobacteriales bacterium]|jgi:uncharacterized protein (TIGR02145 family)